MASPSACRKSRAYYYAHREEILKDRKIFNKKKKKLKKKNKYIRLWKKQIIKT